MKIIRSKGKLFTCVVDWSDRRYPVQNHYNHSVAKLSLSVPPLQTFCATLSLENFGSRSRSASYQCDLPVTGTR